MCSRNSLTLWPLAPQHHGVSTCTVLGIPCAVICIAHSPLGATAILHVMSGRPCSEISTTTNPSGLIEMPDMGSSKTSHTDRICCSAYQAALAASSFCWGVMLSAFRTELTLFLRVWTAEYMVVRDSNSQGSAAAGSSLLGRTTVAGSSARSSTRCRNSLRAFDSWPILSIKLTSDWSNPASYSSASYSSWQSSSPSLVFSSRDSNGGMTCGSPVENSRPIAAVNAGEACINTVSSVGSVCAHITKRYSRWCWYFLAFANKGSSTISVFDFAALSRA